MAQPQDDITIEIARAEDRDVLIAMFLKLLQYLDQYQHDMLPTQENAEWMVDTLILPGALRGEGVLIAWQNKEPIGAVFWPIQHLPYQSRCKTAYGYGTYVDSAYRTSGLSKKLRAEAVSVLKAHDVKKVVGMTNVDNTISYESGKKFGFKDFAIVTILDI